MKKFVLRIATAFTTMAMLMGNSVNVFAAEPVTSNFVSNVSDENVISPMKLDGQYASDPIGQGDSADFNVYMSSYVGFYRTITLDVTRLSIPSNGQYTGTVKVTLYNPDGSVRQSWNLAPSGGIARQQYFLPSSGAWRVHVENNSNVIVSVRGQWS